MSLGGQTVRLIPRIKLKHGDFVDGVPVPYPGCSVQPVQSEERPEDGQATETRWEIFAPPGFPERTENVLTVDGLVDDAGVPLRLHIDGKLQTYIDLDGVAEYVGGYLTEWRG
ncbi:hypothetical protein [Rhodococcus ruber]